MDSGRLGRAASWGTEESESERKGEGRETEKHTEERPCDVRSFLLLCNGLQATCDGLQPKSKGER